MEMLFLFCRLKNNDYGSRNKDRSHRSLIFHLLSFKQRLYCCLLFFFNFFQYVKELFYPGTVAYQGALPISLPFITGNGDGGE